MKCGIPKHLPFRCQNAFSQAVLFTAQYLRGSAKHPPSSRLLSRVCQASVLSIRLSICFLDAACGLCMPKHAVFACRSMRSLHAEACGLCMPKHAVFACRMPAEASPTPPCPFMTNYLVSSLSSVICHLSSVICRPSSFPYRPSSVILRLSSFICHPSFIIQSCILRVKGANMQASAL
jgi:hypothetical protein